MEKVKFGTELWLGTDALNELETIEDKRVFVVADPFLTQSGEIQKVTDHLINSEYQVFDDIVSDPPIEKIIEGVTALLQFKANKILAIGGGSAMDAGKAMKFFANKIHHDEIFCLVTIPTTSGTGSEVTNFSVITLPGSQTKFPLVTDEIQPDIAILDASLVTGAPPKVTADTGMDVLTHILEAYVSTAATTFSDAYCEKAIQLVFNSLDKAYRNGSDKEARQEMHTASCMAGMAFNTASLGLNHGIAHALGARLHIPHGRLNAILLPEVITFNAQLNNTGRLNVKTAKKYMELAHQIGITTTNPRIGVKSLIRSIQRLRSNLVMPTTLTEFGIQKNEWKELLPEIAEAALRDTCTPTNPVMPTLEDVKAILHKIS